LINDYFHNRKAYYSMITLGGMELVHTAQAVIRLKKQETEYDKQNEVSNVVISSFQHTTWSIIPRQLVVQLMGGCYLVHVTSFASCATFFSDLKDLRKEHPEHR